tara:strand:- start:114 stop:656 length:543 start_codon:yes stop_codon:yes gene_type:complete
MAQTSILYTEYGQQYLTLPLTIKNVTGGLVIVERIYIRNVFDKDSVPSDHDLVLTIDESLSDYSASTKLGFVNYNVEHVNATISTDKNFKVGSTFSLANNNSFTFTVVFNPNIYRDYINRGNYSSDVFIEYSVGGISNPPFQVSVNASCTDKEITMFSGVNYSSVDSLFGISVGNVRNLN